MKRRFFSFSAAFLLAGFSYHSLAKQNRHRLPKEVQEGLNKIPENAITLPFLLSEAMKKSDSFRGIVGSAPASLAPELAAKAPLDVLLSGDVSYYDDEKENATGSVTALDFTKSYELGVSKKFFTGTSLSAGLASTDSEYVIQTFGTRARSAESTVTLGIEQSLVKDAFGRSTRKSLKAGRLQSEVALDKVIESAEDWTLGIASTFYSAWLNQQRALTAMAKLETQKDLTRITKLRVNRGASAKPELLQIESAYILAQTQAAATQEELAKIWRLLISTVKFPTKWMNVDPIDVPIKLEEESDTIQSYCKKITAELLAADAQGQIASIVNSPKVKTFKANAEASNLAYEASKANTLPDLAVYGQYGANGIDDNKLSASMGEAFEFKNKFWALGLKLSMPLGFRANRAEVYQNVATKIRNEAEASDAVANLELDILNECAAVERLLNNRKLFETSLAKQKQRDRLEKRRFESGRVTIREAIQASNDLSDAEFLSAQNTAALHLAYWQIKRLKGDLHAPLKKEVQNYE